MKVCLEKRVVGSLLHVDLYVFSNCLPTLLTYNHPTLLTYTLPTLLTFSLFSLHCAAAPITHVRSRGERQQCLLRNSTPDRPGTEITACWNARHRDTHGNTIAAIVSEEWLWARSPS
ncbi:hypothetical protein ElyMa_001242800 [Elysia marginata]|uniref:Secreted protein n=1 Tax=Elysia marginata TaxID=1093978 RepID=A0AAV4I9M0_9GAST|nr:hypothetical protein ElyMa_001242800 [Elysia marginata]